MRKKTHTTPGRGKYLLFLFSVRARLGVLVLAFFAVFRAVGLIFVTALHFFAGAGRSFVGTRALLAGFASKHRQGKKSHGGESEEEFFHNEDFVLGADPRNADQRIQT